MTDKNYMYMPYEGEKPCTYVVGMFEDLRKRMYHSNMLEHIQDIVVSQHILPQLNKIYEQIIEFVDFKLKLNVKLTKQNDFRMIAKSILFKFVQYRLYTNCVIQLKQFHNVTHRKKNVYSKQ